LLWDLTEQVTEDQSVRNMLQTFGITVNDNRLYTRNVAAVMVTAEITPFSKKGSQVDVVVSSMGDASSLEGGTLLMTPLIGKDNQVYAHAQGNVSIGGVNIETIGGERYRKNYALVGRVPNGAVVEREIPVEWGKDGKLEIVLKEPKNVKLTSAAVCQGNLTVKISAFPVISQPQPFSQGQTVVTQQTVTNVTEQGGDRVMVLNEPATVADLAKTLNALSVSARDIISIFQALKQAGSLKAELVIM